MVDAGSRAFEVRNQLTLGAISMHMFKHLAINGTLTLRMPLSVFNVQIVHVDRRQSMALPMAMLRFTFACRDGVWRGCRSCWNI